MSRGGRDRRLVAAGLRSLRRHPLRTTFMMLGTAVGVTALTVVVAVGQGARRELVARFDRMFSGSSIVLMAGGATHREGPRASSVATLTLEDLAAVQARVPAVELFDPWQMVGSREVVWRGRSRSVPVMGHSERGEVVWNRGVTSGAFFTERDVATAARVALVGEVLAAAIFGPEDPVGQEIRIGSVPFRVIGVLERAGADPHGTDRDDEVHVPVTTAMRRLQNVDYVNAAKLVVTEGEDLTAVTGEVAAVLRERHALPPEARDDFTLVTPRQVMDMIRSSERVFSLFLPLLAGAALLVAGIVVANLMFMAVNERRAEIGLRKAVGACARDVRLQLLVECATVTLAGGVLGVAASWLGLRALPGVLPGVVPGWQGGAGGPGGSMASMSSMPWEAALLGLASAILVGVLAGLAPARAAARLDPVRALR